MGVCMKESQEKYYRNVKSLGLGNTSDDNCSLADTIESNGTGVYSEEEACYIMWHVFNTLQDRRQFSKTVTS